MGYNHIGYTYIAKFPIKYTLITQYTLLLASYVVTLASYK